MAQPRKLISSSIKAADLEIPVASAYTRRLNAKATVEPVTSTVTTTTDVNA